MSLSVLYYLKCVYTIMFLLLLSSISTCFFLLASPSMNKLKQFYVVLKKYHPAFYSSFYVTGLCCPQYTTMHSHYLSYTFILVSLCLYCYVSNDFFPCLISAKNILLIHVPVVIFRLWKISFI